MGRFSITHHLDSLVKIRGQVEENLKNVCTLTLQHFLILSHKSWVRNAKVLMRDRRGGGKMTVNSQKHYYFKKPV